MSRSLRIVMISSEVAGLARTGGLGDVVDALSHAMADLGHRIVVVTPRYGTTTMPAVTEPWKVPVPTRVGWGPHDVRDVGVLELPERKTAAGGLLRVCLVEDPTLFARAGIYGDRYGTFGDNDLRFATLSRAGLEIAARIWDGPPDVVHAHDWHAAFAVLYQKRTMGDAFARAVSAVTIHNLAYQGVLGEDALDRLAIPRDLYVPEILRHEGHVNLLKGATALCDTITTVSPRYAWEITTAEGGFGLHGHLAAHAGKLVGITNGIDTHRFDPATDSTLERVYDAHTFRGGKAHEKARLQRFFGIDVDPNAPLFSTVSRFVHQKGIDLFAACAPELVAGGAQVILVGQGDADLERIARDLAARFPSRVGVRITFDEALARTVHAGSDFFVVPSRFEPCGLTQMYAMRYGAVPVVTRVGGLYDTVSDVDSHGSRGTGVVADFAGNDSLLYAFSRALALFGDKRAMEATIARGMAQDFSWTKSARAYENLFDGLVRARR